MRQAWENETACTESQNSWTVYVRTPGIQTHVVHTFKQLPQLCRKKQTGSDETPLLCGTHAYLTTVFVVVFGC